MNDIRIGHLVQVEWIELANEVIDLIRIIDQPHSVNEVSELLFIECTIGVLIYFFEKQAEAVQELLMLMKLEVQYNLLKVAIHQFALVSAQDVDYIFSRHLLNILQVYFVERKKLVDSILRDSVRWREAGDALTEPVADVV